ncbi:MAG: hypothetical protein BACD_03387 [Bacteroides rodentium]
MLSKIEIHSIFLLYSLKEIDKQKRNGIYIYPNYFLPICDSILLMFSFMIGLIEYKSTNNE